MTRTDQESLLSLQRRLGAAERLAALGALTARLAHEMGTPLHSIAGHLDLVLQDPALAAAPRARLEIVAGEVDRLSGLLRGYLRRLRAPRARPRPADVNALVERILALMEPVLSARGIRAATELAPAAAEAFPCDADQVEQVLLNLVQNATDAMPGGGELRLRTGAGDGTRAISVSDTGTGIAPADLARVGEPFFTTKAAGRGTGLGLALCKEIAASHGGDVRVDSQRDVGTVVTFTLGALPLEEPA